MNGYVSRLISEFDDTEFHQLLNFVAFYCESLNLSENTLSCYIDRLVYLFRYCQETKITFEQIDKNILRSYISTLKDKVSVATINGRIRVFRRAWNIWTDEGLCECENPTKSIKLLKEPQKIKNVITADVVQRILNMFDKKTFEGYRNYIMVLLLWDGMMRKSELLNLTLDDIDIGRKLIKVNGKGNKQRFVPLGFKSLKAIQVFIHKIRYKYPGDTLICMRNGERLKSRQCNQIFQRLSKKIGIRIYPHLLRHSAATHYIRQGGPIAILQNILGHSSIQITIDIYGHLTSEDACKSYEKFSPTIGLKI